jgi:hypothetical protein
MDYPEQPEVGCETEGLFDVHKQYSAGVSRASPTRIHSILKGAIRWEPSKAPENRPPCTFGDLRHGMNYGVEH